MSLITFPIEDVALASLPGGWPDGSPARSAFFDVVPEGLCSASFEDLYSVFRRTCAAYNMRPYSLARKALAPLVTPNGCSQLRVADDRTLALMNGAGEIAERWIGALGRLTLRSDLRMRTLLPLRNLVPMRGLLSASDRFCPQCFRDDETSNRPKYHRLLWTMTSVEACPLHGMLLQSEGNVLRARGDFHWLPGVSIVTGHSLAAEPSFEATSEKLEAARLVAKLLDDVHRRPEIFETTAAALGTALHRAVERLFCGVAAHFAKHLGVSKGTLHGWMSGDACPTLPAMVHIAYCCGCQIADLLCGNEVMLSKRDPFARHSKTARTRKAALSPVSLDASLTLALESDEDFCAKKVAANLGMCHKYLRKIAPESYAALVQRRNDMISQERSKNVELRFEEFYRSFESLRDKGIYPSRRKVAQDVYERTGLRLRFADSVFVRRAQRASNSRPPRHEGSFDSSEASRFSKD
ncbi:TniQ family protein [Caballeronia sp. GAOx1]|uniref:TniQ family protein n=1 Tax=Caballeronia sp. GAOx1 TaxID=2921761 RepID=UPI002542112C|nr:TniQ family protein [Caballeronia sp. GAOx1]